MLKPHDGLHRSDALELDVREAALGSSTWNAQTRSVRAIIASGAGVPRRDYKGDYLERLDPAGMTAAPGVKLLNAHQRQTLDHLLGTVSDVRVVGERVEATLQLSERAAAAYGGDIASGVITGVSIGYSVEEWREETFGKTRIKTAVKWTLREVSLVPIPADATATLRSATTMHVQTTQADAPLNDRGAINQEIRSIAKTAGLPQSWVDAQIDRAATADEARSAAFTAMQARSAATQGIRIATASITGHDANDPEWRARTIGEALYTRMTGAKPSDAAQPFVGLSIVEIARDCLRTRGLSTTGAPGAIIERALSTSDLPNILGDSVGRTMRQSYDAAPSGLKRVARQTTARDFRAKHRIQLSVDAELQPALETGEFRHGAIADEKETYKLGTFGRIIGLTRQALVNDDLGALSDLTRRMGVLAADFEAQFLTDLVEKNGLMDDGKAVFHADHGNLAAAGASIGDDTLSAGRVAMRAQKDASGMLIAAVPRFLIVPSALETTAEKQLSAIRATMVDDANVWSALGLVVEPRLSDAHAWYLSADPATIDGLEFAYLEGEPGPQIFSEVGFESDGVKFKIRLDFGGAFVEPRGWFKNAGQ